MRGLLTAMLAVSLAGQTAGTQSQTIRELAQTVPTLSTLNTALTAGDLLGTLSGAGPFTVFAPTDDAFAALPGGLQASLLLPAQKELLVTLLGYHVVNGSKIMSSQITNGATPTTLQGSTVLATVSNGQVRVNNNSVSGADNEASNGVVHIIDGVLTPSGFLQSIVELVVATPRLSTLAAAVGASSLVPTLSAMNQAFTVFAPSDTAFLALTKGLVDDLVKPQNQALLDRLLTYHVSSGRTLREQLPVDGTVATLDGSSTIAVTAPAGGGVLTLDNDTQIIKRDCAAGSGVAVGNGVAHVVDKVLRPPNFFKDIVDLVLARSELTKLAAAVGAAELVATLREAGPFTVFAPSDAAFQAAYTQTELDALLTPAKKADLVELLTYHVVSGATPRGDISNNMAIPTVEGRTIVATLVGGAVKLNAEATVIFPDVFTYIAPAGGNSFAVGNGIVHIIDKVLVVPPQTPSPPTAGASLPGGSVAGLVIGLLLAVAV